VAHFREAEPPDEHLRFFERLDNFPQPPRALGGGQISRYSNHSNPPVVRPPYAPLFQARGLSLIRSGAEIV
jgi:hypothetical protein